MSVSEAYTTGGRHVGRLAIRRGVPAPFGEHYGIIDNFSQVYRLERHNRALQLLQQLYLKPGLTPGEAFIRMVDGEGHSADRMNEQFASLVVSRFLISDPKKSKTALRAIIPSTTDEELATLVNDRQFDEIYERVHRVLDIEDELIRAAVKDRLAPDGDFGKADRDAYEGNANSKSWQELATEGITLVVPDGAYATLMRYGQEAGSGQVPIIERMKNDRRIQIGTFEEAKARLIIHDVIDHMWFMSILDREGVLTRHQEVLERVGNPGLRHAFGRESEMLASIAYGVRYRHCMQHGLAPIVTPERLLALLEANPSATSEQAVQTLRSMCRRGSVRGVPARSHPRRSVEYHSLGFVFSNYITELNEQRRKHGKIKVFDEGTVLGELNPFSSEFIALFVDAHHELLRPHNKHLDSLAKAQIMLEDFFVRIAEGRVKRGPFVLKFNPDIIKSYSPRAADIPDERVQWIRENPGFLARKRALAGN